jgi:uncharacterized membrane protein
MNKHRIESLTDGVFAIVMTLLVLEIKIPEVEFINNYELAEELISMTPLFISYFVSFAVLTTYWISHHYLITIYSKNMDRWLTHLNLLFLAFVSLIPFSSHFLGTYQYSKVAIIIFGVNVMLTSSVLFWIRKYLYESETIENNEFSRKDLYHSQIRILLPVLFANLAILFSFINPEISLLFFAVPTILNLIPGSITFILNIFKPHLKTND